MDPDALHRGTFSASLSLRIEQMEPGPVPMLPGPFQRRIASSNLFSAFRRCSTTVAFFSPRTLARSSA